MRAPARIVGGWVAAAALILTTAVGCGGESSDAPTATAGNSGAQVQVGNTINYGSVGTSTTLDCAGGKSLTVGGSNNTLTVRGTCTSVNVGGADNKVTLDTVTSDITTVGLNNTVTYHNGEPKLSDVGSNNTVGKA